MRTKAKLSAFLAGLCLVGVVPKARSEASVTNSSPAVTAQATASYAQEKKVLMDLYRPFLAEFEGMRYNLYDDKGRPAVGWGCNFDTKKNTTYSFLEITPIVPEGEVSLNKKDMVYFASGASLEVLRKQYPQYKFARVTKTASELKGIAKPKGNAKTFKGSVYVMAATTVDQLNEVALGRYIDKTANEVGPYTFYKKWPIGWAIASTDMCYVRGTLEGTRFLAALKSGDLETACAEAWTSKAEQNEPDSPIHYKKHKRRMETRGELVKKTGIKSVEESSESLREYMKLLPGEPNLYHAMGIFFNYVASYNMNRQGTNTNANATSTQNSSDGR